MNRLHILVTQLCCLIRGMLGYGEQYFNAFDPTGLLMATDYIYPYILEHRYIQGNCSYSGPNLVNISWYIIEPRTKLIPFIDLKRFDYMTKTSTKKLGKFIRFKFRVREDFEGFQIVCEVEKMDLQVGYLIPKVERADSLAITCKEAHFLLNSSNDINCGINVEIKDEPVFLYYENGSSVQQISPLEEIVIGLDEKAMKYVFRINGVTKKLNGARFQCFLVARGKKEFYYSKVQAIHIHYATFEVVPLVVFGFNGTINSTTFRFKMDVNPTPTSKNFVIRQVGGSATAFPVSVSILVARGSHHVIEVSFEAPIAGLHKIEFTDKFHLHKAVHQESVNFTLKLMESSIETETGSRTQVIHPGDGITFTVRLTTDALPKNYSAAELVYLPKDRKRNAHKVDATILGIIERNETAFTDMLLVEVTFSPEISGNYQMWVEAVESTLKGPIFTVIIENRPVEPISQTFILFMIMFLTPMILGAFFGIVYCCLKMNHKNI